MDGWTDAETESPTATVMTSLAPEPYRITLYRAYAFYTKEFWLPIQKFSLFITTRTQLLTTVN